MQRLKGRLGKLETVLAPRRLKPFRLICCGVDRLANLANSKCTRYISNGTLFEVVDLDGSPDHLSDAELEEFIESFPIQPENWPVERWT